MLGRLLAAPWVSTPILCSVRAAAPNGIWLLYAWYFRAGEERREVIGFFASHEECATAQERAVGLALVKKTASVFLPSARGWLAGMSIWDGPKPSA